MKQRTIATALILFVLLALMIWSFGSSAATSKLNSPQQNPEGQEPSSAVFADEDENEPDADLGKLGSHIDREQYLRERDEYVARKRGIEPGRPFNPTLRGRAIEQMERQEKNSRLESIVNGHLTPASGGAWSPIGPLTLPNGVGSNSGPTSGRVTSIAVDPTNSQKVYLGTAQGGVWRSLDGGTTWTSIFDNAQTQAIGALAVAPSSPTTLYVGTGEFNGCGDCFFGVGLYRIDNADSGATLNGPINPQQTVGNLTYNIFNGRGITKILVHPTDPATIWVSTARGIGGSGANALGSIPTLAPRGLWRSSSATSATPSFTKLTVNNDSSVDSPGTGNADVVDMVMEPGSPDNITVGVIGLTTGLGGIYRTTDATAASPTFTQRLSLGNGVRTSLAINKSGSTVTVYAATSETPTVSGSCTSANSGAVRKSVDGGVTWSAQLAGGQGFCSGQCFYDMPIAVDPNDVNHVYIGGQTSSSCGRLVGKSTDGGTTFVADGSGLHADEHALAFDSAGNIFSGNDGGIWRGAPNGSSATTWTNLNTSPLNTLQFESIAVHPTDQFLMIGGTQDNGTEFQQTSSGNWRRAESGDGGYALIDQSATDTTNVTMYHTFFNDNTQMGFDRIFKTACLPVFDSWPVRGVGFGADDPTPVPCDGNTALVKANGMTLTSTVLFYAPMALGPGAPNTLYFGADRLYRSSDQGDTMVTVSQVPLASPASPISTIAIWKGGDNIRVVGTQNGQVWATSTGSSTLVNITPPIPANPTGSITNKFIGRAMIDPNNNNVAYVTLSYYAPAGQAIWKITNLNAAAGSSPAAAVWAPSGTGIPSVPINAFAIDPLSSNNLYAGTDIGVYFSNDAGASWTPFGTGLPHVAVFDLQIQPTSRILRAATHGRGIWENHVAVGDQTITVGTHAPANAAYNTSFTVAATSSSGLPVSYSSAGVCTNVGSTFTTTSSTGTCTVKYDQAGDSNSNAAPQVTESVTAQKANQTITVGTHAPANATYNTSFMVAATSNSSLPVAFSSSGVCTNVGATFSMTSGTGTCTVKYDQAGDSNFNAAAQVTESVTAQKANQTITVGTHAPANATYNTSFTVSATSNSGLPVSYSSAGVCTNVGATFTMTSGSGTCTVKYDQVGDNNYNAASQMTEAVAAQKANQSITVGTHAPPNATYNTSFTVAATSDSGLPVAFSSSGVCTNVGATFSMTSGTGTCTVKYDQAGDSNFNAAPQVTESVTAQKAATSTALASSLNPSALGQSVTFTATVNSTAGTPTGTAQFKIDGISSGSPIALNGSGVAQMTASSLTAGTHAVTADYSADTNFAASTGTLSGGQVVNNRPLISLNQSNYSVNESTGFITITVNRTGDTSVPVTVDYATDDTGASKVCTTLNSGFASSQCDFSLTLGTLRFAANETQKTFVITITQDSFIEGPETFSVNLSNATGANASLTTPSSATVTINDSVGPSPNAIDDPSNFVRMHYHDFLNREPDQSGLDFWTGQITSCGSDPACTEVKRINVSAAFFLSIEFQQTGYLVERMYKTAYGDATGTSSLGGSHQLAVPIVHFNEFLRDTQRIGQGVVVLAPGWEQALENNKQAYALEFVGTMRFITAFPTTMTPDQFVDKLNLNAGNVLSPSERTTAISLFSGAADTSNTTARAQALRQVAENTTLYNAEFNRAFVLTEFFGYLRRNPNDTPDTDHTGYEFWLNKLNQFNGDYLAAEMVKAFISSSEYRQRFGP